MSSAARRVGLNRANDGTLQSRKERLPINHTVFSERVSDTSARRKGMFDRY